MDKKLQELINYRIEQSHETISETEFLIKEERFSLAINRIYYGMFYLLLAVAIKYNFKTSKHNQLTGWFNKDFVKTGIIDRRWGRILHKAFEDRTDADYGFLSILIRRRSKESLIT